MPQTAPLSPHSANITRTVPAASPVSSAAMQRLISKAPIAGAAVKPKIAFRTPLLKPLADAIKADEAKKQKLASEKAKPKPLSSNCEPDFEKVLAGNPSKTDVLAAIDSSWLGRVFAAQNNDGYVTKQPGSSLIFANVFLRDATVQQVAVGYRFTAARVYDALQQDEREKLQQWKKIEIVEELRSGIWKVDEWMVIGKTGDIVDGKRIDWTTFLETGGDLFDLVKTKDAQSFPSGISTAFKSRATEEKMMVAKRYVLSNSAENG